MEGLALIQWFREWTDAPIIVLSEQNSYLDKVEALYAGADDYMVKPFHEKELAARIFSALRRRISAGAHTYYEAGNLKVDFTKRHGFAWRNGGSFFTGGIPDHRKSCVKFWYGCNISDAFGKNMGTICRAKQQDPSCQYDEYPEKIESSPLEPEYITTIPRVGYRMLESQAEKGGMQMLENQTGRNMKVMEGQNIRNGIRMTGIK